MIIYLHSKFLYDGSYLLNETRQFCVAIFNTCVPTFFAVSGYLFFRNFRIHQLKGKLYRRIKSLLIPYLIWNIMYVAFMIVMSYLNLTSCKIDISNILELVLNAECSPLWFVRYLMLFALIAPFTYIIFHNRIIGCIAIIAILALNYYNYISGILGTHINVNANNLAMFNYQDAYYALGAYCALNFSQIVETVNKRWMLTGLISILLLICVYWFYLNNNGNMASFHLFRFLWIPALWFAIDYLSAIKTRVWMKYAFFIYCSHMFLIYSFQGVIEKVYAYVGSLKPLFACIEYILMGIIVAFLLINAAELLKKNLSPLFKLISGSRG